MEDLSYKGFQLIISDGTANMSIEKISFYISAVRNEFSKQRGVKPSLNIYDNRALQLLVIRPRSWPPRHCTASRAGLIFWLDHKLSMRWSNG